MHQPPAPDTRTLLPPILSCLPTAFLSPRPPPVLLPLLSPILRQRVTLLADTATGYPNTTSTNSRQQNWLQLLTWSKSRAERLVEVVGELQLEPHPVSGELELFSPAGEDSIKPQYRRLDEETLYAKSDIYLYNLAVIWQWCEGDNGGTGIEALSGFFAGGSAQGPDSAASPEDAWRVSEIRPLDIEVSDDAALASEKWFSTISKAQSAFEDAILTTPAPISNLANVPASVKSEEDDGYWAQYDASPEASRSNSVAPTQQAPGSHAPAQQPSPAPQRRLLTPPTTGSSAASSKGPQTELDYYSRYDDFLRRGSTSSAQASRSRPPLSLQPTPPHSKEPSDSGAAAPDDAAYWSRYDATPGTSRRPSTQTVPQVQRQSLRRQSSNPSPSSADADEYWSRYGSVQPALDSHDPDEEAAAAANGIESSLGNHHPQQQQQQHHHQRASPAWGRKSSAMSLRGMPASVKEEDETQEDMISRRLDELAAANSNSNHNEVHSPSPSRPGSAEGSVAALEEAAERESMLREEAAAETAASARPGFDRKFSVGGVVENGIKQHISSEIKSLFMLSQKVGIDRAEFERLVKRELDVLGLIEL